MTLVELTIAFALLGILSVLLFSVGSKAIEKSNTAGCASAIRQTGAALFLYRADNNGLMPPGYLLSPVTPDNPNPQTGIDIKVDLINGGYLTEFPFCPASKLTDKGLDYIRTKKLSKRKHLGSKGSYALNILLTQTPSNALPGPYWPVIYPYQGDHRMLMLGESYYTGIGWATSQITSALKGFDTGQIYIEPRHHGDHGLHFMFLDGHVEMLSPIVTEEADGSKTFDWSNHFSSWGRGGKYADFERARSSGN